MNYELKKSDMEYSTNSLKVFMEWAGTLYSAGNWFEPGSENKKKVQWFDHAK